MYNSYIDIFKSINWFLNEIPFSMDPNKQQISWEKN